MSKQSSLGVAQYRMQYVKKGEEEYLSITRTDPYYPKIKTERQYDIEKCNDGNDSSLYKPIPPEELKKAKTAQDNLLLIAKHLSARHPEFQGINESDILIPPEGRSGVYRLFVRGEKIFPLLDTVDAAVYFNFEQIGIPSQRNPDDEVFIRIGNVVPTTIANDIIVANSLEATTPSQSHRENSRRALKRKGGWDTGEPVEEEEEKEPSLKKHKTEEVAPPEAQPPTHHWRNTSCTKRTTQGQGEEGQMPKQGDRGR